MQVCGGHKYVDLKDLVFYARTSKSKDLRDKAYSVLGLADPEIYTLYPDYRAPVKDVYKGVARALASQSLDFLSACQNPERHHGLPSRAPNLADDWKAIPFESKGNYIHACGDPKRLPECGFDEANDILVVKGYRLDVLLTVSEAAVKKDNTDQQLATICGNWMKMTLVDSDSDLTSQQHSRTPNYKFNDDDWRECFELKSLGNPDTISDTFRPDAPNLRGSTIFDDPRFRVARGLLLPEGFEFKETPERPLRNFRRFGFGRRFGLSKGGDVGLVPAHARPGDLTCIFYGASFPYILRSIGDQYVVVGEACKSLLFLYQIRLTHEKSQSNDNLSDLPAYIKGNRMPTTDDMLIDFTLI